MVNGLFIQNKIMGVRRYLKDALYYTKCQTLRVFGWTNMEIDMSFLRGLMDERGWYELKIQREEMEGNNYAQDVARWEDITIS